MIQPPADRSALVDREALNPPKKTDWMSIGQLAFSGASLALSLLAAGLFGVFGLALVFGETGQAQEATAMLGIAWVLLFLAVLTVPSIVLSLRKLLPGDRAAASHEPQRTRRSNLRTASLALILWPLLVLVGTGIDQQTELAWLLLPPLQLLIIAIPTWWLVELLRRGLPETNPQREWGIVNFSVFITTPALMLVEILAFGVLLAFFALWLSTRPDITAELERLMEQILRTGPAPEAVLEILLPYLSNPWVILGTLGLAAGLVPLIEELIKPLAVWLLMGRSPSTAEGFVAGALCGAAFGLVESLLYLTNPTGDGWAGLAAGRTGTVLLHTATTALVGWSMAAAWKDRRYTRMLGVYLLAALLHGLWNGLAVLTGFGGVLQTASARMPVLEGLAATAPFGIVLLGLGLFGVLLWGNRRLRQHAKPAAQPVTASAEPRSDHI